MKAPELELMLFSCLSSPAGSTLVIGLVFMLALELLLSVAPYKYSLKILQLRFYGQYFSRR